MADRTRAKYDCQTWAEYWAEHGGPPPKDARKPWWMVMGEKPPPDSPRRLVRPKVARGQDQNAPRRRLVRVGKTAGKQGQADQRSGGL